MISASPTTPALFALFEDFGAALIGPFASLAEIQTHVEFRAARQQSGTIPAVVSCPHLKKVLLERYNPLILTPDEDRAAATFPDDGIGPDQNPLARSVRSAVVRSVRTDGTAVADVSDAEQAAQLLSDLSAVEQAQACQSGEGLVVTGLYYGDPFRVVLRESARKSTGNDE